jgi:hypothetical protein
MDKMASALAEKMYLPYLCPPFTSSSMVTAGMKRNQISRLKKQINEKDFPTT